MTTKPKTRKAAAKPAAPNDAFRPHRGVVITVEQRDEMDDILHLIQTVDIAVRGAELDEYELMALLALVEVIETRMKALIKEFGAFSESEAA